VIILLVAEQLQLQYHRSRSSTKSSGRYCCFLLVISLSSPFNILHGGYGCCRSIENLLFTFLASRFPRMILSHLFFVQTVAGDSSRFLTLAKVHRNKHESGLRIFLLGTIALWKTCHGSSICCSVCDHAEGSFISARMWEQNKPDVCFCSDRRICIAP